MKLLIIEDEDLAARKLKKLVLEIDPEIEVVGMTESIETSVEWLQQHPAPDLILMDIELCDGQSFEIFNQVEVKSAVIFTTAYDEYALKAFRVNSIDYLLKPVREEDLRRGLEKYQSLKDRFGAEARPAPLNIDLLMEELRKTQTAPQREYRERFLVKFGQRFVTVETDEIAYFFAEDRVNFIKTRAGQKYMIDYTLDELEQMLTPKAFFRANRQFIVHFKSVDTVQPYFNSKLKITLKPATDIEILISREKASAFKEWMGE